MDTVDLFDDTFTYGGWSLAAVALCAWFWFAYRAFPSFETFVRGFDDELHFGDTPEEQARATHLNRMRQAALVITTVAGLSLLVGLAIPD